MTTKQMEIMNFLQERVFEPILTSTASNQIKQGVRLTITRLENQNDAAGMLKYYWSAIAGKGNAIEFSDKLKDAGYIRFEEIFEEFREKFSDAWLREK
ncbi:hypothetical protein [Flavobacterium sp. W20_MBD1_R3]|uniref:hypothetical protein n=1 Tax=Flavobacterium sp. W20_MBD1_R3 TaxID=3240278 RepID=UPI003F91E2CF